MAPRGNREKLWPSWQEFFRRLRGGVDFEIASNGRIHREVVLKVGK